MRRAGSLVMRAADAHKLPAGGALAVDRHGFSAAVTEALEDHPRITIAREEITELPPADWGSVIVATGPLTSASLGAAIARGDRRRIIWPFSTPSRPSCIANRSISTSPGSSRATTRKGPGGGVADYINLPLDEAAV